MITRQKLADLQLAEACYYKWVSIGLSRGVALEKSAEEFSLRKSQLAKYLRRHIELPKFMEQ